jgi:hypothetical protein
MAITRPNDRFSNRAFRVQSSTPPAIEHLSFASPDSCTESAAEPSTPEQAMIPQQAMMKDALPPHTPSPLPADADATVTGTDIVYLADLQPQPVEWLWQHRLAARPTGAGLPKRKFAAQWLRDCLQPGSQTQGSIEIAAERDGVCIATLRRAEFDIGVRSSKDGKSGAWWWTLPPED